MKECRTVVVLLTVIAAALVMNVVVMGSRSAEAQTAAGPVEPTLVNGFVHPAFSNVLLRFWSDGTVDESQMNWNNDCLSVAECTRILIPGTCASDITRNGAVEFADMLSVLEDWGPCPERP